VNVDSYHRLIEAGIIGTVELIEGRLMIGNFELELSPAQLNAAWRLGIELGVAPRTFEQELHALAPSLWGKWERAAELYRALCNTPWQHEDGRTWSASWRAAGDTVAGLMGETEDYLSYYCSGGEGQVADWIAGWLAERGWQPVEDKDAYYQQLWKPPPPLPRAPAVVSVEVLEPYRLRVLFADGEERQVDIQPRLREAAFERLRDLDEFARVFVHPATGAITWRSGADLDPDWIYANRSPLPPS
jgi:hypothetical protein